MDACNGLIVYRVDLYPSACMPHVPSVKAVGRAASFHDKNKAFCRFNKASAKLGNYLDAKIGNKCYFSLT